jgi:DNA-binding response OmpR family regulator
MANREALRELQSRLASRLQAARDYITKPVDATELMAKIKALG